jgi:hypothetical protein
MSLLNLSPATDLAVLLFAPDIKVSLPSAHTWQQQQQHSAQDVSNRDVVSSDEEGKGLLRAKQGDVVGEGKPMKQQQQQSRQNLKLENVEEVHQDASQDGWYSPLRIDLSTGQLPEEVQAEAKVMEGFAQFQFSQGEQLAAILQLREHLQTLLQVQLAGGGLQARNFSVRLSHVLGEAFEAERKEQNVGDETLCKAQEVLLEQRKKELAGEEVRLVQELQYWEEESLRRSERGRLRAWSWNQGGRGEGYQGGVGESWDVGPGLAREPAWESLEGGGRMKKFTKQQDGWSLQSWSNKEPSAQQQQQGQQQQHLTEARSLRSPATRESTDKGASYKTGGHAEARPVTKSSKAGGASQGNGAKAARKAVAAVKVVRAGARAAAGKEQRMQQQQQHKVFLDKLARTKLPVLQETLSKVMKEVQQTLKQGGYDFLLLPHGAKLKELETVSVAYVR